jgi:hypothetical protein
MSSTTEFDSMLVTHIVGGQQIQMSLADKNRYIKNQTNTEPIRLVMVVWKDNCQFCSEPQGPSEALYVSTHNHMGFISCPNCLEKMQETYNHWMENFAYGDAKGLLGQKIRVLRSNGQFDDDWELHPNDAYVLIGEDGQQLVNCKKTGVDVTKHCPVKLLFEWNS